MWALRTLLIVVFLACTACGTTGVTLEETEPDPVLVDEAGTATTVGAVAQKPPTTKAIEGAVPQAVARS
jgi:hypothetical protein